MVVVDSYWFGQVREVLEDGLSDRNVWGLFLSVGTVITCQSWIFLATEQSQNSTKFPWSWVLTEKLTRSYLQQLQELSTSGRVMKMNKKLLLLANTFIQRFATISVSGDKLKSLPVIKLCMCVAARHADYGINCIYRCFFPPTSHKAWRQHFSVWWCLCLTGGIHHTTISSSCLIYFLFIWQFIQCKLSKFSK